MKLAALIAAAAVLVGCQKAPGEKPSGHVFDQCFRAAAFERCLTLAPAGPQVTKYNDWSEVIDSCDDAARYQSWRPKANVPDECDGGGN